MREMGATHDGEELREPGQTRGEFLRRAAGVGVGLAAAGGLGVLGAQPASGKGLDKMVFLSPLATLDVMSFYDIVVPNQLGYFKQLGLEVPMLPGTGGTNVTLGVAAHEADLGWPSPGILTYSVDSGVPVYSIWESAASQVFDFALPANSKITKVKQLAGKKIALHNEADFAIGNPILKQAGVDPKSVKYVTYGELWPQATALGQADAALVWEGLRGQLDGEGLKLKYLLGSKFSKTPSNTYAVRKADLKDPKKRDIFHRFLMGVVMGNEFGRANLRAAAQITYGSLPALQALISPQVAVESMAELATSYAVQKRLKKGWGYHDLVAWQQYLDIIYKLKQSKHHFKTSDILTNEFVGPANKGANVAKAHRDAKAFKLDKYFSKTKVPNYPY